MTLPLRSNTTAPDSPEPRDVVVFHFNGIGDHLLCLPALRALSHRWPGRLRLIGGTRAQDTMLYDELPLRDIAELDFEWTPGVAGKRFDPDAFLDAADWTEPAGGRLLIAFNTWFNVETGRLLAALPSEVETVGFFPAFQHTIPTRASTHACDRYFSIARHFDSELRLHDFHQAPRLPPEAHALAAKIHALLPTRARVLAVHSETQDDKRWPLPRFRQALERLLERHPDLYVVPLDKQDQGLVPARHTERVWPISGLPLAVALALTGEADAFLGIDSCMLHAADFFRLPSVGLFGPTDPQRWGFRFTRHRVLQPGPDLGQLDVETVVDAVDELLPPAREQPVPARQESA